MKFRIFTVIVVIISTAGFLLTGIGASGFFNDLGIPDEVRKIISYFVAVILCLIPVCVVIYLYQIFRYGTHLSDRLFYRKTFFTEDCGPDSLGKIIGIAASVFSNATSPEDTKRLHSLDNRAFTPIYDSDRRFRGYYCVFRLSRLGKDAIERNEFHLQHVPNDYIRQDDSYKDCNLYIGALYADGMFAKHFAIGSLFDYVRRNKPKSVFARAATGDGIRLLGKYKFVPLDPKKSGIDHVYVWRS